jgi:serine/threonine protein phosphatase 1
MKQKSIICLPLNDTSKRFLLGKKGNQELLAIALNPSTANEVTLDPTSRNIETLALNNNCDGWYMVNLYPGRTSKPEFLPKTPNEVLLKENFSFIENLFVSNDFNITKVLLCWGNEVDSFRYLKESAKTIIAILDKYEVSCYFMKMTRAGNPYHPAPTPVNRWLGGINNVTLKHYSLLNIKNN